MVIRRYSTDKKKTFKKQPFFDHKLSIDLDFRLLWYIYENVMNKSWKLKSKVFEYQMDKSGISSFLKRKYNN